MKGAVFNSPCYHFTPFITEKWLNFFKFPLILLLSTPKTGLTPAFWLGNSWGKQCAIASFRQSTFCGSNPALHHLPFSAKRFQLLLFFLLLFRAGTKAFPRFLLLDCLRCFHGAFHHLPQNRTGSFLPVPCTSFSALCTLSLRICTCNTRL